MSPASGKQCSKYKNLKYLANLNLGHIVARKWLSDKELPMNKKIYIYIIKKNVLLTHGCGHDKEVLGPKVNVVGEDRSRSVSQKIIFIGLNLVFENW